MALSSSLVRGRDAEICGAWADGAWGDTEQATGMPGQKGRCWENWGPQAQRTEGPWHTGGLVPGVEPEWGPEFEGSPVMR